MCFIKEQTQNYNEIANVTTLELFLMLHGAYQAWAKTNRCFPTTGIRSTAWQWTFCSVSLCLLMIYTKFLHSAGSVFAALGVVSRDASRRRVLVPVRSNLHETEFPWLIHWLPFQAIHPLLAIPTCCWSKANTPQFHQVDPTDQVERLCKEGKGLFFLLRFITCKRDALFHSLKSTFVPSSK